MVMLRFLADCEELKTWMKLKMLVAKDANYEEARNLHHKWQKHKVTNDLVAMLVTWLLC